MKPLKAEFSNGCALSYEFALGHACRLAGMLVFESIEGFPAKFFFYRDVRRFHHRYRHHV